MNLHPELEDLARQLESANAEAEALVAGHSEAVLERAGLNGAWSAASCLMHVADTAAAYQRTIRPVIDDGHSRGILSPGPYSYGVLAKLFIWAIEPPVRMRFKAPKVFQPEAGPTISSALATFCQRHRELIQEMERANGLNLAELRVVSPASERIRLPLGAAFGLMAAHARRHLWQARRAVEAKV